jgi:hypothetical protein
MSSQHRTVGAQLETAGGQLRLYDAVTFNSWLSAEQMGNQDLARQFEARFRPEYRVAFDAWMKTDPFNNPRALPGPMFMPEYHVSSSEQGAKESLKAESLFNSAAAAREHGDDYIRVTVFLAAVLFPHHGEPAL